jgi:hypothetical protein
LLSKDDTLLVEKESGTELPISTRKYHVVGRGGKGHALFQRGSLSRVVLDVPVVPNLEAEEKS